MVAYTKPWLPIEDQAAKLAARGVELGSLERAHALLRTVGYYRLTGYLYPFRLSETYKDEEGRTRWRVLSDYWPGTTLEHARQIIDFDRRLRMLVMDGVERIEVAVRMQVGYVLGRTSVFAHEDPAVFTDSFTAPQVNPETGDSARSDHDEWLRRVLERRDGSDEGFVAPFRDKYDGQMPIWALTEVMEMGHLARLYRGLHQQHAEKIAHSFDVPTKALMGSWLASLNYVRNVAAHHARLFNRKLQHAPRRPKKGQLPLLDHLRDEANAKGAFGTYNTLAVIAYLLRSIEDDLEWCRQLVDLIAEFPLSHSLSPASMGVPEGWGEFELWSRLRPSAETSTAATSALFHDL